MPAEPVTEMLEYRGSSWFCIGYCSSHGMLTLPGDRASWPETKSWILTIDHKTVKLADSGLAGEESLTEMKTAEAGTYRWIAPGLYSTVTWKHGRLRRWSPSFTTSWHRSRWTWDWWQLQGPWELRWRTHLCQEWVWQPGRILWLKMRRRGLSNGDTSCGEAYSDQPVHMLIFKKIWWLPRHFP